MKANNKVNVGIAGLGRSGWNIHARIFKRLPEKYRVVAVADPMETRREEAIKEFGCKAYPCLLYTSPSPRD